MLAAETFPLVCALPDVPPVNWGYNAAYFLRNKDLAAAVPPGGNQPAMPVLSAVLFIAEQSAAVLGTDPNADAWLLSSPVAHLDTITAPVQVTFSTADVLVPLQQVSPELVRPLDAALFPAGFTMAMEELLDRPEARRTLLSSLPEEATQVFVVPVPDAAPRLAAGGGNGGPPVRVELPFSEERQWTVAVIAEGAPEPGLGHFKYALALDREPFQRWALDRGIAEEQLTVAKLTRLMMRLQGEETLPATVQPADAEEPFIATHLDFPAAERADVLRGLTTFAAEDQRAERLAAVYQQLPPGLRALGPALGDGTPQSVRSALLAAQQPPAREP